MAGLLVGRWLDVLDGDNAAPDRGRTGGSRNCNEPSGPRTVTGSAHIIDIDHFVR
jgi:hypothetical protein